MDGWMNGENTHPRYWPRSLVPRPWTVSRLKPKTQRDWASLDRGQTVITCFTAAKRKERRGTSRSTNMMGTFHLPPVRNPRVHVAARRDMNRKGRREVGRDLLPPAKLN